MQPKYTQLRLGEKPPRGSLIERTCTVCGVIFHVKPSSVKHGRGQTCSRACQYRSVSAKSKARVHPETSPRVEITCPVCGKVFRMTVAMFAERSNRGKVPTYCSKRCAHDSPEWKRNLGESLRHSPKAKAARKRGRSSMLAAMRSEEGRARNRANHQRQMADPEKRKRWEAMQQMITAERATLLVSSIAGIVVREVEDVDVRARIAAQIGALLTADVS